MAWKDEIQEEANKVANASWASALRDSMYTSLTKLANFYETILVELTPKIEEKAEAKTLEILGGANSESVAAEVVLARNDFQTLDMRLDYNDAEVATLKTKVNSTRRDVLLEGSVNHVNGVSNSVQVKGLTIPEGVSIYDYDAFEVLFRDSDVTGKDGRKIVTLWTRGEYYMASEKNAIDIIILDSAKQIGLRTQYSIPSGKHGQITKVVGIKY